MRGDKENEGKIAEIKEKKVKRQIKERDRIGGVSRRQMPLTLRSFLPCRA
jgi:hypothetical protein